MIKVALFEDKPDLRDGLSELLKASPGLYFCGAWENCNDVKKLVQLYQPDVVLMDIEMPGTNGLQGLKIIREFFGEINVLMLTVFEDDDNIFNALCLGANGYLLKRTPPAKIIEAIIDVHEGGAPMTASIAKKVLHSFSKSPLKQTAAYNLTQREKEILASLVKGNSYKMIGNELNISLDTVRTHIRKIYDKLHVHSMNEAVSKAIYQKIV